MSKVTSVRLELLYRQYKTFRKLGAETSLKGRAGLANHWRRLAVWSARQIREVSIYQRRAVQN